MIRVFLPVVLIALVFQLGCAGPQSYVGYQGNQHRSGEFAGSGPEQKPSELWRFLALDSFSTGPWRIGDTLYALSGDDSIYAVDTETGKRRWRFQDGTDLYGLAAMDHRHLYVRKEDDVFAALNARDGTVSWTRQGDPDPGRSLAATGGGRIYFSKGWDSTTIVAMDAGSGEPLWQFDMAGGAESSPTLVNDTLFMADRKGYLYALNASTGEELWRVRAIEPGRGEHIYESMPAYRDGLVVARWSDTVVAVDVNEREVLWRHELPGHYVPTVARGLVFIAGKSAMVAVDERTGEVRWTYDSPVYSEAAVAGDRLYFSCYEEVCAMNADTGEILWRYPSPRGRVESVMVHEGRLYITTHHGYLIALE